MWCEHSSLYGNLYVYVCVNIYDINMCTNFFVFCLLSQVVIPYPEFMGPISLSYQLEPKRMHKRFTNLRICVWSSHNLTKWTKHFYIYGCLTPGEVLMHRVLSKCKLL